MWRLLPAPRPTGKGVAELGTEGVGPRKRLCTAQLGSLGFPPTCSAPRPSWGTHRALYQAAHGWARQGHPWVECGEGFLGQEGRRRGWRRKGRKGEPQGRGTTVDG